MSNGSSFGIGGFIMGGVLGLLGICLFIRGAYFVLEAVESDSWHRTDGHIVASEVVSTGTVGSRGSKARIEYTYSVGGSSLRGSRVRTSGIWTSKTARASVTKYKRGKTVAVFYNPDDLTSAVLEPGINVGAFGMPCFGLLFLGSGILFGWLSYRERASE